MTGNGLVNNLRKLGHHVVPSCQVLSTRQHTRRYSHCATEANTRDASGKRSSWALGGMALQAKARENLPWLMLLKNAVLSGSAGSAGSPSCSTEGM